MCCHGGIIPIVLGGHSEVLDMGRQRRLATDPARTITLTRPDGTTEHHGPSINRHHTTNVA